MRGLIFDSCLDALCGDTRLLEIVPQVRAMAYQVRSFMWVEGELAVVVRESLEIRSCRWAILKITSL